jgi:lysophospholipase L1-like esterase
MHVGSSVNWIFLGDSLTEGVGSSRISYVSELAAQIRAAPQRTSGDDEVAVHEIRLRKVDPAGFDRFVRFNLAGHLNQDSGALPKALWLWNLASEGRTIETDFEWVPLISNLRPELVVIFRGSLESIVRPAMLQDGSWPEWVPKTWRGYAAMDPRCYLSTTRWRRSKQQMIGALKQKTRLHLLRRQPGRPLMALDKFSDYYVELLSELRSLQTHVIVLGLLPPDGNQFPGSPEYFLQVNERVRNIAVSQGATFLDWASELDAAGAYSHLFYRDGFHFNLAGSRSLAGILHGYLASATVR